MIDDGEALPVDEFSKHELMDRASFVLQIFEMLDSHPAQTEATSKAHDAAFEALHDFYLAAADECFKED
jgi:hypothetical protein